MTYAERLLRESPPAENLKEKTPTPRDRRPTTGASPAPPAPSPRRRQPRATPAPAPTPSPRAAVEKPAPTPAPRGAVSTGAAPASDTSGYGWNGVPAAAASASDPAGPGFAVQVSIFDSRQEADRLANQLIAKGYPAFVVDPAKGRERDLSRTRRQVPKPEGCGSDFRSPGEERTVQAVDRPVADRMRPIRLLLVEDSENDASLLIEHLRQGGYEPQYTRVDSAKSADRRARARVGSRHRRLHDARLQRRRGARPSCATGASKCHSSSSRGRSAKKLPSKR